MGKEPSLEEKEVRLRKSLVEQAKRAIELRNKDREFHGVEREFYYHQAQMIVDYDRTKDIKHPRDLGNAREVLLRKFLVESGYLPKKYSVSDLSVRVASETGHVSNEIDIALYNDDELITLMKRQDVYEVYPIESVHGVIQVKSNLTKKELNSGLKNLMSFKTLKLSSSEGNSNKFAVLFAYCSDMKWEDLVKELKDFAYSQPKELYPNAVFILDRGFFIFGEENGAGAITNVDIESINKVSLSGFPDRQQLNLYHFQTILLKLLSSAKTSPADLGSYFRLPLVVQESSYSFSFGSIAEVGHCEKHGDFAKKISAESLKQVIEWCTSSQPINWLRATHLAYGRPEDKEAYQRQPQEVYIYNPEGHDLSDILTYELNDNDGNVITTPIAYDSIETNGMIIWIPYYYSAKESIISSCIKCEKAKDKKLKK
ncbi:DUF6602 domain-containing protein [Vibrio tasmaniensis]|uniref:DUF6602 domain-containing protein n=1 Tax=Vibrio tasmaniensis TaxID=212663 RepID=UPI00107F895A|nr:DUF6602 domain-containing protein [Vibrio tasmaniensis]